MMQVVIVPIQKKDADRPGVNAAVDQLHAALKAAGIRVKVGRVLFNSANVQEANVHALAPASRCCLCLHVGGLPVNVSAVAYLGVSGKSMCTCVQVDANDLKTPGWRYNYWELKGVPLRVEVGPKDVANNTCVTARRDRPGEFLDLHCTDLGGLHLLILNQLVALCIL